jgi:uncharacterized protein YbdZ (MbtH family)
MGKMTQTINLSDKINTQLPSDLVQFMMLAGSVAARQEQGLFLVGGSSGTYCSSGRISIWTWSLNVMPSGWRGTGQAKGRQGHCAQPF